MDRPVSGNHSNSYWLGEDIPCLTYGLRGVIHSTLTISSKNVDLHSGVDGGAVSEPLIDMVKVLSELVNSDRTAKIPGKHERSYLWSTRYQQLLSVGFVFLATS